MNRLAAGIAMAATALLVATLWEGPHGPVTLPAAGTVVLADSNLPEGHPPLQERSFVLPEGHPPVYEAPSALPEGHPVCPHGSARQRTFDSFGEGVSEAPESISI